MESITPGGPDDPWVTYTRHPTGSGWTYPVGQAGVRAALDSSGVRVRYLSLGGGWGGTYDRLTSRFGRPNRLLRAWWTADGNPNNRPHLDAEGHRTGWTGLDVFAVPSDIAAATRRSTADELLADSIAWLAAIPGRGQGWQASSHERVTSLEQSRAVVTET